MNIPPKDHPIWPLARVGAMLAMLWACLTFGYSSGFDEVKDLRTMLVVGLFSAMAETVKRMLAA